MNTSRKFVPWGQPFVQRVAESVSAEAQPLLGGRVLDLSKIVCVFPASRPLRSFQQQLILGAKALGATVQMPKLLTVGSLPEYLLCSELSPLDDVMARLFWVQALKEVAEEDLAILYKNQALPDSFSSWFALADFCARFVSETASGAFDIRELDSERMDCLSEEELSRWNVISSLAHQYDSLVKESGFVDKQFGRLTALRTGAINACPEIHLIGTADINPLTLEFIKRSAGSVCAHIYAPES
ncbi:MAG: hypothetical protein KDD62_02850, partial [Bdellovibrionales bacterium]|nr:hypothetical protein [Bdellovibrionales bacterium]